MKDYNLKVRVRNGPLISVMRAARLNQAELARRAGLDPNTVSAFVNLKLPAVGKTGKWRKNFLQIAAVLGVTPDLIVPPQHVREPLKKNVTEKEMSFEEVQEVLAAENPEEIFWATQKRQIIDEKLDILNPKQRKALEYYYGLGCQAVGSTYDVAKKMKVSDARVQQLVKEGENEIRKSIHRDEIFADAKWKDFGNAKLPASV